MSFTDIKDATARINRSELAVPGSNRRFLEKAAQAKADVVFLDLEDSVSPELKDEARKNVIEALNDLDWGEKTVSVRLNGLDTAWTYRDVVDVLEQTGERLDLMMLPKVGVAADVYALDVLVSQVERAKGRKKRIGFELIIESALGLANANAIAGASPRNESLHFGVADFAASVKADTTQIGGPNPRYAVLTDPLDDAGRREVHWGDMWHYPVWQMVVAARAHGLRPIDGPFGDFSDEAGFRAHAGRAMVLGCEGKWAIHPSQVALANEVFSPSDAEVAKARKILKAMEEARAQGQGAVALDGKLIDLASIRQAEAMVKKAEKIG
ncbi:CoA ester lyase [Iodidimonas muriae]|uniref:CoA ester lyase n=1 Tax=Iodidimonas muriae TaxID=261467 RepID=A0ABQ2LA52_9PROT|nr:CoA ester lyase [Iodidimonas muriae]GGO08169.1 CoA ester lyase [Iodidimonas muriae]